MQQNLRVITILPVMNQMTQDHLTKILAVPHKPVAAASLLY